jgi:hypothetical protein
MGSRGSGSFSDYPNGSATDDQCDRAFAVSLEDIEHCDFFKRHAAVPPIGTVLTLAHQKRIVAQTQTGEVVGNLPTRFNYLASCLRLGYTYQGEIRQSRTGAVAVVSADFIAVAP